MILGDCTLQKMLFPHYCERASISKMQMIVFVALFYAIKKLKIHIYVMIKGIV